MSGGYALLGCVLWTDRHTPDSIRSRCKKCGSYVAVSMAGRQVLREDRSVRVWCNPCVMKHAPNSEFRVSPAVLADLLASGVPLVEVERLCGMEGMPLSETTLLDPWRRR